MALAPSKESGKVAIELMLEPILENRLNVTHRWRSRGRETFAELVEVQPDQSE
jgi:hypothetical protein